MKIQLKHGSAVYEAVQVVGRTLQVGDRQVLSLRLVKQGGYLIVDFNLTEEMTLEKRDEIVNSLTNSEIISVEDLVTELQANATVEWVDFNDGEFEYDSSLLVLLDKPVLLVNSEKSDITIISIDAVIGQHYTDYNKETCLRYTNTERANILTEVVNNTTGVPKDTDVTLEQNRILATRLNQLAIENNGYIVNTVLE